MNVRNGSKADVISIRTLDNYQGIAAHTPAMFSVLLAAAAATAPVPTMTMDWWSNYYDTPGRGLALGELSVVVAEIMVDRRGHFAACNGQTYQGNPRMGPYVCERLQKRADFSPARGPDGQKIMGVYRKLIIVANVRKETRFPAPRFGIRIPGTAQTASSNNPFEIQFYLDANGLVSDCSLIAAVGINLERHKQLVEPAAVQRACAEVSTQMKPVPPRDKKGIPIPTVQNAIVTIDSPIRPHNQ